MGSVGLLASVAHAHDADVVFVQWVPGPPVDQSSTEIVTLTAGTLGLLAPVDSDGDGLLSEADLAARKDAIAAGVWDQMPLSSSGPCKRYGEESFLREGYIELRASFVCPEGRLLQEFKWLSVLPPNYSVVAKSPNGIAGPPLLAQGPLRTLAFTRPGEARPSPGFIAGARGGLKHALAIEHLGFALLLAWVCRRLRAGLAGVALFVASQVIGQWVRLQWDLQLTTPMERALDVAPFLLLGALAAEVWLGEKPSLRAALMLVAGLEHGLGLPGAREGSVAALSGFGVAFAAVSLGALLVWWWPLRWVARSPARAAWGRRALGAAALMVVGWGVAGLWTA